MVSRALRMEKVRRQLLGSTSNPRLRPPWGRPPATVAPSGLCVMRTDRPALALLAVLVLHGVANTLGGEVESTVECADFNSTPWKDSYQMPSLHIQFLLFTRSNPDCPRVFSRDVLSDSQQGSLFNTSLPTKVIIHGFRAVGTKPTWVKPLAQALVAAEDVNVLAVDWLYQASFPYMSVVQHYREVGLEVSVLINALKEKGSSLESFHFICVSLGAHVCGFIGTLFGGKLGRITGLDPAGPLVKKQDKFDRLDPSDALFVEAIHTDSDNFGISIPIGHVSFFLNGGKDQPGCSQSKISSVYSYVICDHMRAIHVYMSSLNSSCPLVGIPCPSYQDFLEGQCLDCQKTLNGTCPQIETREIDAAGGVNTKLCVWKFVTWLFVSGGVGVTFLSPSVNHVLLELEVSPLTRNAEVLVTLKSLGHPNTEQRLKLHTSTTVYKQTLPLPVPLCTVDSIHMRNVATWFHRKEDIHFLSICLSEFPSHSKPPPLCVMHVHLRKNSAWSHDFVQLCGTS
ncbi:phospholipase A1 member A-like [Arapaima gigas]